MTAPRPGSLALGLGTAVAAISSAALLILVAAPLPPAVIAGGRVAITGVVLAALGGRAWRHVRLGTMGPGVALRMILASGLLALHFGTWVASLSLTTVPRSVALVATQPLFAGLMGRWVGDRAPWSLWIGAGLAVVGTGIMVSDEGSLAGSLRLGDGLAVVAAAAASGYLLVGRSVRERVPLRPYLSLVHIGAALWLLGWMALSVRTPWPAGATSSDLLAVIYLGLVPGVLGHGLLNWAVRHLPVHVVTLAILLEPVGAMALTALVLDQGIRPFEALGAGVLLLGVAVGVPRRAPPR